MRPTDGLPFRADQALASGRLTRRELASSRWHRLFYCVHILTSAFDPDDHLMWCRAAALLLPGGAALGGWSAAFLHGAPIQQQGAPVWINLPVNARLRPRDRLHLLRTPLPDDDLEQVGGIPATTAIRAAFDLGRYLPRTDALVALDALCHGLVKVPALESYATEHWEWPHTRSLRALLPLIEPLTESPMETHVRLLLIDAGLPTPAAQIEVHDGRGRLVGRVDLGYRAWQIAIEYDGDHHRDKHQFRRDLARANALREAGWFVLQFTADDVLRFPERLVRQVQNAIAQRR